MRVLLLALPLLLSGCADHGVVYRVFEPAPDNGGPYGGDGTIDMVVAYFSFDIDAEHAHGHMGAHCGFDDWSLDPPTAKVHTNGEGDPDAVVMRQIHPHQSTEGVAHFGTAPSALWRQGHTIGHAFGDGEHGTVHFNDEATFRGLAIPRDKWLLVETTYTTEEGRVTETLHLRHFPDVPVDFDREQRLCA